MIYITLTDVRGKFYLINAPWGFSTAFNAIKGLLDEVTAKKIHILGSSYKTELLKQIPAENLPKKFGGLSETAGEVELSDEGPWTDPKYASSSHPATASAGSNIQKVTGSSLDAGAGSRPTSVHAALV